MWTSVPGSKNGGLRWVDGPCFKGPKENIYSRFFGFKGLKGGFGVEGFGFKGLKGLKGLFQGV